jgi:hypothetical protein
MKREGNDETQTKEDKTITTTAEAPSLCCIARRDNGGARTYFLQNADPCHPTPWPCQLFIPPLVTFSRESLVFLVTTPFLFLRPPPSSRPHLPRGTFASRILFNLSCNAPPVHLIFLFSYPQDNETNHGVFLSQEGAVFGALPSSSSSPSTTSPTPLCLPTPSPWLEREPAAKIFRMAFGAKVQRRTGNSQASAVSWNTAHHLCSRGIAAAIFATAASAWTPWIEPTAQPPPPRCGALSSINPF